MARRATSSSSAGSGTSATGVHRQRHPLRRVHRAQRHDPALDQTFDAEWTLDLAATYKLGNWDFTLGADNVLDEYPDEVMLANSTGGQLRTARAPFGFNGAFVYGKVGYKW